ncbi:High-affnity carbon uptake protein Hat/HatR [hydrothermal vent metagenome]|uniref:High-affnity carbon uptake protein Hat/HatR n=1 Tax=hydrothermal vent metagenome TaxID=652676 RepID=A0A1W1D4B0_9ZZZZ
MQIVQIFLFFILLSSSLFAKEFYSVRISAAKDVRYAQESLKKLQQYIDKKQSLSELQKKLHFQAKLIKSGKFHLVVVEPFKKKDKDFQQTFQLIKEKYKTAYVKKINKPLIAKKMFIQPKKSIKQPEKVVKKVVKKAVKKVIKKVPKKRVQKKSIQQKIIPKTDVITPATFLILEGKTTPLTILKIKVWSQVAKDDIYYAFIKSDINGKYQLTKQDIDLAKLQDGKLTFVVQKNSEKDSSLVQTYTKTLDKGLALEVKIRGYGAYANDNFINAFEQKHLNIIVTTEPNIKDIVFILEDEKKHTLKFQKEHIVLDTNQTFTLQNIDISSLDDSNITLKVQAEDVFGNQTLKKLTFIKDTKVKKVKLLKYIKNNNLSNVVNKKILVASGKAEPNATIYLTFKQQKVKVTEEVIADKNGYWELLGGDVDITLFKNGKIQLSIYQVDEAKNKSQKIFHILKKFKKPIFPISPIPIDPSKYQILYTVHNFSDEIRAVAISQDRVFAGSYGVVKVFGKAYMKFLHQLSFGEKWVNAIALQDGKIYVGLSSGEIKVFYAKTLKFISTIKVDKFAVLNIKTTKDKLIVSTGSGIIKVYDRKNYSLLATLKSHQLDVGAIAVANGLLYSGSDDYSIKVWDLKTYKLIKTLKSAHAGVINDILVYKDMLISASDDTTIIIRDVKNYEIQKVLHGHKKGVSRIKIDNNFLVSAGLDRVVILWDLETGKKLKVLRGHSKRIRALAVDSYNIVTGSMDYKLKIWGYDDSRESLDSNDETSKPLFSLIKSLYTGRKKVTALLQNGNYIITAQKGKISFYDVVTYNFVKSYSTLDRVIMKKRKKEDSEDEDETNISLKIQPINAIAIIGSELFAALSDTTIKIWDLSIDKSTGFFKPSDFATTDIISDTSNFFVATKGGMVDVYDIETKELLNEFGGHQYSVNTIATYNDEYIVSAGDDYSIKVRDIETGDMILDIKNAHDGVINKIVIYKDKIISASADKTIKVRDIKTGRLLHMLTAHTANIRALALSDKNLISGSDDKTIKVWSLKDFSLIKTITGHKAGISGIVVSDDYIISSSDDKTLKVWKYYE